MKRIVCVYLSDWPIQRLVAKQPELRRQRVVLYTQDARGQRVSAISPAARRDRVRVGMPLSEAKSILRDVSWEPEPRGEGVSPRFSPKTTQIGDRPRRFPVYFMPHDRTADRTALVQLALSCESLAPRVGLEPDEPPECLFLDVAGVAHLFGGEAGLLAQIQRHFQQRGYTACAVLADTIGAAWGQAKFGGGRIEFSHLPVGALRLAPTIVETLRQLGVERVSQVQRLPRADLSSRFGDEIHRRLDQASGARDEVLDWVPPPVEFYTQRFLDFPTTDATTIQFILSQLVEQLCQQMRARQRGGLQWECRLYSPDQAPQRIDVSLFQPAAEVRHVMPLVRMQMEQQELTNTPGKSSRVRQVFDGAFAVHHVSLSVTQSVVLIDRQRQLFDENPRLDKQELSHLINRLSARLGADRVVGARVVAEAQPELACRLEPLVGQATARHKGRAVIRNGSPLQRPLRLHSPLAIDVISSGGDDSPTQVLLDGERCGVAGCWGPERIETGWWRGPSVRRDYWRVELDDGRWLWLFCDLRSREWFCQGEF